MIFVKILKIFLLVFFCFLLVITSVLLQLNSTIKNTVFSNKYFNRVFDGNIKPGNIEKLVEDAVENVEQFAPIDDKSKKALKEGTLSPEIKKMLESYKEMLRKNIDMQWLTTEIPKMIKGLFAYFTGNSESIPPLYIKPLKNIFVNVYAEQISMHSGNNPEKDIGIIVQQIDKVPCGILKDGKVNGKAVDELMKLEIFKSMGLSRETAERIAEKIGKRKEEGTSGKGLFNFILREMLEDKMGVSQMKDELDLNLLFETIYGGSENPMTAARAVVNGMRSKILTINTVIFFILLLIIIATAFYPSSILRWSGAGFILSGGLCLVPAGLSGPATKIISVKFAELQAKGGKLELLFIQEWILSYISGIIKFMLIQGIIIIAIGITLIILGFFVSAAKGKKDPSYPVISDRKIPFLKRKVVITLSRASVIILLITAIPLSIISFSHAVGSEISRFNEIKERAEKQKDKISTNEALDRVLNSKLFKAMSEGGNEEGVTIQTSNKK